MCLLRVRISSAACFSEGRRVKGLNLRLCCRSRGSKNPLGWLFNPFTPMPRQLGALEEVTFHLEAMQKPANLRRMHIHAYSQTIKALPTVKVIGSHSHWGMPVKSILKGLQIYVDACPLFTCRAVFRQFRSFETCVPD